MMSKDHPRIIKKYPNRRIYDTAQSKYITLADVRDMVVRGVDFQVIDTQTKEDITRSILLQIIIEQESENDPLFSTDNLQNFIRYYGERQHQGFSEFINQSLSFFAQQQEQFQSSMNELMEQNPVQVWSDLGRQRMEMWQEIVGAWLGGLPPEPPDEAQEASQPQPDREHRPRPTSRRKKG